MQTIEAGSKIGIDKGIQVKEEKMVREHPMKQIKVNFDTQV